MYKLLIVDDEHLILEGLKVLVDWRQYGITEIETATNYDEAIDKALRFNPHIAIVDVRIENFWGYDLLIKLNNLGLLTKYVMISGYEDFDYVRSSLLAGAKDYILKPIDKQKLQSIVSKIIVEDFKGTIEEQVESEQKYDPILKTRYSDLSKLTNKIILIIMSKYSANINLKYVADLFQMNSTYIGQVFLKETNLKFSEYLLAYRMYKAREMIENSNEKISYIAHMVGYTHLNYFYMHFKSFYNLSPKDLREIQNE